MRKLILFCIAAMIGLNSFGQAQKYPIKDGTKITLTVNSYTDPNISDQKFLKANSEKKNELIAAYNESVNKGTIVPNKYSMTYVASIEPNKNPNVTYYKLTTKINGVEYSSYATATADTLYLYRIKGVNDTKIDGKSIGFSILGVQKIAFNLKVGDKLPTYEDIAMLYPQTTSQNVREQVYAGLQSRTTTEVGPYIDSYSGNVGNGLYQKTTTSAVYNTIETEVRKTLTTSSITTRYVNAHVSRTEQVMVNGKPYNAFVIESESWTKNTTNTTYESERESAAKALEKAEKKWQDKMNKNLSKAGFLNEDGYSVSYLDEWFVPEFGVVKSRSFDTYGGVAADVVIDSIE